MFKNQLLIRNVNIYTEDEIIEHGHLYIKDGLIHQIIRKDKSLKLAGFTSDIPNIDAEGLSLIPGFIDGHIHGANGADVMDATEEALDIMARALPKEGTTSFLATTITQSKENISKALENISKYENKPGYAEMIGVHLEGPFINKEKKGAQPGKYVLEPTIEQFNKWHQLTGGKIKTITMAPELDPDGKFIQYLFHRGINISAGHTSATFSDMRRAVSQGVRQVTHICNAMTGIHHRDIGVVGAAFMLDVIRAELIADGIHVTPEMLEIIYQNIGSERLLLITDAMRAKCMPQGMYDLGGQNVYIEKGKATLEDGTLAGSILKLIDAARLMLEMKTVTIEDVIKMASENPAKQIGIYDRKGSIAQTKDADLLIVDENLNIKYTICRGVVVGD